MLVILKVIIHLVLAVAVGWIVGFIVKHMKEIRRRNGKRSIGYSLENIENRNQIDPRHFLKPTEKEINDLSVCSMVRLVFF